MNGSIRKVWMNDELHKQLTDHAWDQRTTPSAIIRDIIHDVAKDPNPKWLAKAEDVEGTVKRSVSVLVPDDEWLAARDATWPHRVSLAKQVRLRIKRIVGRVAA